MPSLSRSWARGSLLWILAVAVPAGCATQSSGEARKSSAVPPRELPTREASAEPVSMRAERGSIDRDDAEEAITRHFGKLKRCYEAAGPAMGFAAGAVRLHFDVGVDGRTLGVNVIESRLGNFAVERCLSETAGTIRFPRPHGGARATFEYSMEFRSSEERSVVDLPEEAAAVVRPGIFVRLAADCGSLGVAELDATLYIDRRGQVLSAGLAARTAIPAESARCTVESLQRAPLPLIGAPAGDAVARVTMTVTGANLVAAANVPSASSSRRKGDHLVAGRRQRRPRR